MSDTGSVDILSMSIAALSIENRTTAPPSSASNTVKVTRTLQVLWWTADSIFLRCPWCDANHGLPFIGYEETYRLVNHGKAETYEICFPEHFELDRVDCRIVTIQIETPGKPIGSSANGQYPSKPDYRYATACEQCLKCDLTIVPVIKGSPPTGSSLSKQEKGLTTYMSPKTASAFVLYRDKGIFKHIMDQPDLTMRELPVRTEGWSYLKIVGHLNRGKGYPPILAISGFKHLYDMAGCILRTEADRLDKPWKLMKEVGHTVIREYWRQDSLELRST